MTFTKQEIKDLQSAISEAQDELCVDFLGNLFPEGTAYYCRLAALSLKLAKEPAMTAEIIMFKDYKRKRDNTAKALADELREEALLPALVIKMPDEPFQFTSPRRPTAATLDSFTDKELCELSDWIFGKPGATRG